MMVSKDDTEAVVRPFLEDDRVRYVKTENRGQPAAKNTGIELSRAPLVAFLDADDLWLPTKVAKQVAVYEADPDLGVVYCRRCLMDPEGQEVEFTQPVLYRGPVLESIFEDNFICFSSAMVSQRVFELVGLFDERRRQNSDYDLWVRAAPHFRFDYVDEPLVWYRQGHASLKQGAETLLRSTLEIRSEFLDLHGGRALLSPRLIRRANALIYNNLGLAIRRSRPLHALTLFARSIAMHPASPEPWLGIVGIIPFSEPVAAARSDGCSVGESTSSLAGPVAPSPLATGLRLAKWQCRSATAPARSPVPGHIGRGVSLGSGRWASRP